MTRRELAEWLCANVQRRRLQRIGEPLPKKSVAFGNLPDEDQRNWLDMADAVLEYEQLDHPIERFHDLARDWVRYTMQIHDPAHRDEMRRALIVEMQSEVDKLSRECQR